ncbi:Tesmin/TSO1-like CXC domain, cysteine-rich domain [Popillia japonica]|uniref:Tesmin/TSO1-like CXC domain, cysteine-rich domain n=1 Tax=Popillia japonica TaxID=7064 RepID=A0AAW1LVX1_POPJA
MSCTEKGNTEDVESLINTYNIHGATIPEAHLSSLSSSDLEQFAELSQSLNMSSDMENQATEEEISTVHIEEAEDDELVQTELGAQEVEIETEHDNSPEEILPEAKPKTVPPLRPLTIAPKPAKVPIAIKPVAGQQLLLVQSAGVSGGQQFKLLSPHTINLSNIQLGKPLAVKPTIKTITTSQTQPKQVVMKKVISQVPKPAQLKTFDNKQGHVVVVQKSEPQMKIVNPGSSAITAPTKTITLAQAQQMGLLQSAKIVSQNNTSKQAILLNKAQPKSIKLVRSPTKILPAPQTTTTKVPQRILVKSNSNPTLIAPNQLIQVAGGQPITAGQIHQINIPGKGVQYIKFVTTQPETTTHTTNTITAKAITQNVNVAGTKIVTLTSNSITDGGNIVLSEVKPVVKSSVIAPKPFKPAVTQQATNVLTTNVLSTTSQLIVLPTHYIQKPATPKVAIPIRPAPVKTPSTDAVVPVANDALNLETNGMRPRKPCNCNKSQCLKLYCDCFANGEFCYMCKCINCYNNLENEEHRQRAIKNCLERNPNAFRPKIGKSKDTGDTPIRKHTKGCNCKRSGCLKNYCECYEAKIACSSNCKCIGCRNIEDTMDKKNIRPQNVEMVFGRTPPPISKTVVPADNLIPIRPRISPSNKQAFNYINIEVIEATTQCLLALANNAEANAEDSEVTKSNVIEEFGRCLVEIISCSLNKNITN